MMSEFKVYLIKYYGKADGIAAVAVSATSGRAAMARLRKDRDANPIGISMIEGRRPEYAQDRIEGTCDLDNPMLPPPDAGSPRADEIRERNRMTMMLDIPPGHPAAHYHGSG